MLPPDSFNFKETNNSLSETSYGRKNFFLDTTIRLDMVIDIFQNSKWWYLIHISRLLQNFKVIDKAVIFYAKTGSKYLRSTNTEILKSDFVKSTLWSLFLQSKCLWFVPHTAVSSKEKKKTTSILKYVSMLGELCF